MELEFSGEIFKNTTKFNVNPSSGSRLFPCGRMDGRTDMKKLIVAFRNLAKPSSKNMAHAHCMLDTYGYRLTLRICNTHCFSTATVVTRPGLHIMLHVHCLSYLELC